MTRNSCPFVLPALRAIALGIALSVTGCALHIDRPRLVLEAIEADWDIPTKQSSAPIARTRQGGLQVIVEVRADDPYTTALISLETSADMTIRALHPNGRRDTLGAWRLVGPDGLYVDSRVPRPLAFGDEMFVPAGTQLRIECDPATVLPHDAPETGDELAIDVHVRETDGVRVIPVRLRVLDRSRSWRFGWLPTH